MPDIPVPFRPSQVHKQSRHPLRPAVVLSCKGGEEPALNVTRALGFHGVPVIVVSEDEEVPAAAVSRYCMLHRVAAPYGSQPGVLQDVLQDLGREHGPSLPVFPTADPDLEALTLIARSLDPGLALTIPDPALVERLIDKRTFDVLATEHDLPVPRTWRPASPAEMDTLAQEAPFPLIVKPAFPFNWPASMARLFRGRKAIVAQTPAELQALADQLGDDVHAVLVQQYLDGPDDLHYDVHAFIGRDGRVGGTFTGRKWRIYPPHAGSGAFIEAVHEEALEQTTVQMLQRLGFSGIANVNYKRDPRTGRFWLMEINARVSQWSIFTTRMGVNLPWLAYCDALGLAPGAALPRRYGAFFVDLYADLRALPTYRALREWSLRSYLLSLRGVRCSQVFDLGDLRPWWRLSLARLKRGRAGATPS